MLMHGKTLQLHTPMIPEENIGVVIKAYWLMIKDIVYESVYTDIVRYNFKLFNI